MEIPENHVSLDGFLDEIRREEAYRQRIDCLVDSYKIRLVEQGVDISELDLFVDDECLEYPPDEDAIIDRAHFSNKVRTQAIDSALHVLADCKILSEDLEAVGLGSSETMLRAKKDFQADLWNDNMDAALIRLVDEELPGEGLQPDDYDYLLQRRDATEERRRQSRELQQEFKKAMIGSLGVNGALTTKEDVALTKLADSYVTWINRCVTAAQASMPEAPYTNSARENARVILLRYGLNNPRWINLIDEWFSDDVEQL